MALEIQLELCLIEIEFSDSQAHKKNLISSLALAMSVCDELPLILRNFVI